MNRTTRFLPVLILALIHCAADAKVAVPPLFSDHMVLQADLPAPVWGTANPGQEITVEIAGTSVSTKADETGEWLIRLPAMKPGGPHQMIIRGWDHDPIVIHDVLVGEVWIASGQSNMQWSVANSNDPEQEIAAAHYSQIRFFNFPEVTLLEPTKEVNGKWEVCSPQTIPTFSAVAYFFGREIHQNLKVPVGLIENSWGGMPAEAFTSKEALLALPELKPLLDKKAASTQPTDPHLATNLFNGMVNPLIPYGIRGAIWYQGESNARRGYQYRTVFPTMIRDWRERWGQGDFPFLFVQLANYKQRNPEPGDSDWAELHEAQTMTLKLPNTAMATIIDLGEEKDIHPRNKQDVGKRLALAGMKVAYGKDISYCGPMYDSMIIEGSKARLKFKHVDGGLSAKDGQLKGFAIAGDDKKFVWADAQIDGDDVVVWSDQVPNPVAVRYAWANNPEATLYNKSDLPASPFRTDNWRGITEDKQ